MVNQNSVEKVELEKSCKLTPKIVKRMPFAIYDHMSFYLGEKLVFCGGHKRPSILSKECFGLTSPGGAWTPLPDMPRFLCNSAKTTLGDKAFLIGGFEKDPVDSVFSFDSGTEEWKEEAKLSVGRSSACAVSYKDAVYVTGGKITAVAPESMNLNTVEKLKDGIWTAMPDLTHKRRKHGCALVKDPKGRTGILVVGGTGDTDNVQTTVEFLDLDKEGAEWELMPELNEKRCCWPQVGVIEISILAVGGMKRPSNNFEIFDQKNGNWIDGTYKLKTQRTQADAALVPKSFYGCI